MMASIMLEGRKQCLYVMCLPFIHTFTYTRNIPIGRSSEKCQSVSQSYIPTYT